MIRKYLNHKLQTIPWHREEEPLNHHETPGRLIKVGVDTIWCHFGQFKFVQKDHFQRNTNQSYVSIWRVFVLQYTQAIISQKHHFHFIIFQSKKMVLLSWEIKLFSKRETDIHVIILAKACL